MNIKVRIMRGLPGSGKSRWIEINCPDWWCISADINRTINGKYVYNKETDYLVHNITLLDFVEALEVYENNIVVDNTNIRLFELAPYYRLAEAYKCDVEIVKVNRPIDYCIRDNKHNVPEETIRNMSKSMESIPSWWNQKEIHSIS